MDSFACKLVEQGVRQGSCSTFYRGGKGYLTDCREDRACKVTLKSEGNVPYRKITSQYKLKNVPSPSLEQMLEAYQASREAGLQNVRVGNLGVFLKSQKDYEIYKSYIH